MTTMQSAAKLAESTVQRVARDEIPTARRRSMGPRRGTRASNAKRVTPEADELVMRIARSLINGGTHFYSRVEIIDERTVIVR